MAEVGEGMKALKLWEKILIAVSLTLTVGMLCFLGFRFLTYYTGPLILDEWHCSKGEAPVVTDLAGKACMEENATLPAGFHWDPLGNRPYECDRRHGWEPIVNSETDERDCMKATEPLGLPPKGWEYVNWKIMT